MQKLLTNFARLSRFNPNDNGDVASGNLLSPRPLTSLLATAGQCCDLGGAADRPIRQKPERLPGGHLKVLTPTVQKLYPGVMLRVSSS